MSKMVCVILYENGTYEVENITGEHATQRLCGYSQTKGNYSCYYCRKEKWKDYLLKLLDTDDIDREIAELKKKKKAKEKLREQLLKEVKIEINS